MYTGHLSRSQGRNTEPMQGRLSEERVYLHSETQFQSSVPHFCTHLPICTGGTSQKMGMALHAWDGTHRLCRALSLFVLDTEQAARTKEWREAFKNFVSFYLSFKNSTFPIIPVQEPSHCSGRALCPRMNRRIQRWKGMTQARLRLHQDVSPNWVLPAQAQLLPAGRHISLIRENEVGCSWQNVHLFNWNS